MSDFRLRLESLIGDEPPFAWAQRVGISKGAFSRIWNGGSVPKPELLLKIREATGVSVDWLLTGEKTLEQSAPTPAQDPAVNEALVTFLEEIVNVVRSIDDPIRQSRVLRMAVNISYRIINSDQQNHDLNTEHRYER